MLLYSDIFRLSKISLPALHMTYDIWNNDTILSTLLKPIIYISYTAQLQMPRLWNCRQWKRSCFVDAGEGCCQPTGESCKKTERLESCKTAGCQCQMVDHFWFNMNLVHPKCDHDKFWANYGTTHTTHQILYDLAITFCQEVDFGWISFCQSRQKCKSNALHLELTPFVA